MMGQQQGCQAGQSCIQFNKQVKGSAVMLQVSAFKIKRMRAAS
jgi:hypothetical protein